MKELGNKKIFVRHNSEHIHNVDYKGRYVEKNEYKCSFMNEVERERGIPT